MSENTPSTENNSVADNNAPAFSRADAAKAVKRTTVEVVTDAKKKPVFEKDGTVKTKTVDVAVSADEVLDFALRDGVVTVVTTDGQKLTGRVA